MLAGISLATGVSGSNDVVTIAIVLPASLDMALRGLVDSTLAQFASTLPLDERKALVQALYVRGAANAKATRAHEVARTLAPSNP